MNWLIRNTKNFVLHQMMKRGRYISRFPIVKYLNDFGIQCVLDVGANTGQFAQEIRWLGYSGRIESFEPIPSVFEKLRESANGDSQWGVHPFALGDRRETKQINVSANTPSSSFLELDSNVANAPVDLSTVGSVDVEIRTLDEVFEEVRGTSQRLYLKIDTQGFERNVIEGSKETLPCFDVVQMELALISNYHGESLIEEMIRLMRERGFVPWWFLDGFKNPKTLQLYQTDVFFVNKTKA